jgi:hypothetical protein
MTRAIASTYSYAFQYRAELSSALLAACLTMLLLYGLNVYRLVSHAVTARAIEEQSLQVAAEIKHLDAEYLAKAQSISISSLASYGMIEGKAAAYIQKDASFSFSR